MPVSFEEQDQTEVVPMSAVYKRQGIGPDEVAKARKEALSAMTEKTVSVKGGLPEENKKLPKNLKLVASGPDTAVLLHTTVDHATRLRAAEAVSDELSLKPAKTLELKHGATGLLAEVLKEIDGTTRGIPSQQNNK